MPRNNYILMDGLCEKEKFPTSNKNLCTSYEQRKKTYQIIEYFGWIVGKEKAPNKK
jgi:hypothetical protein